MNEEVLWEQCLQDELVAAIVECVGGAGSCPLRSKNDGIVINGQLAMQVNLNDS